MKNSPSLIQITASTRAEPGKTYPVYTSPVKPTLEKPAQPAKKRQTSLFSSCFGGHKDPIKLQKSREQRDTSRKKHTKMWRW